MPDPNSSGSHHSARVRIRALATLGFCMLAARGRLSSIGSMRATTTARCWCCGSMTLEMFERNTDASVQSIFEGSSLAGP